MANSPNRPISKEILEFLNWVSKDNCTDFEKGIITGLRMAEYLAEAIERNSEVAENRDG